MISISQFAAAELNQHIEYLKTLAGYNKHSFLCGGTKPLSPETLKRKKDIILDKYGIQPRLIIHEFRHSHATTLIDNDADLTAVSRRFGHSSTVITQKVYVSALSRKKTELSEINDEIYKNSCQNLVKAN